VGPTACPPTEGRAHGQETPRKARASVPPEKDARFLNRIEVARARGTVIVRVIGLGSVNNAVPLWDFVEQALEDGWSRFAFDLADCRGLDSTFLGTLVGLSQAAAKRARGGGWVCVFNVSPATREIFEIVGADRYVRFRPGVEMQPIETEPLAAPAVSPEKRLALVRRAHENLVSIDRRNEGRFGEFLRCLAEALDDG
jgi:anti-anti-sigma factor